MTPSSILGERFQSLGHHVSLNTGRYNIIPQVWPGRKGIHAGKYLTRASFEITPGRHYS